MKLRFTRTPNMWKGGNRCEVIIIHWWNRPETNPTIDGVVNWLTTPISQVSAHYVVSDLTAWQLAQETDRPWHAMQANDFAIGIEVDPNTPGRTLETTAELIRDIRSRHGNIPIKKHCDYVNTGCPGTLDVDKIIELVESKMAKVTLESERMLNYAFLGMDGRDGRPHALKGECDAGIKKANVIGKAELDTAYMERMFHSSQAQKYRVTIDSVHTTRNKLKKKVKEVGSVNEGEAVKQLEELKKLLKEFLYD